MKVVQNLILISFLHDVAFGAFEGVSIKDKGLVKKSSECYNSCLKRRNTFCQTEDKISEGYCCKGEDCSEYNVKFGFCSN
jgi:hypothetical protein